ncbi:hypothetical protein CK203_050722 [Vitis vinifera]|uniref:Uncharacterized protein n=1 Tax=Vitis vinifera TaxID=29760 RepID=A0A438H8A2_VITVI|nr:hypothetical protein CK203_065242 [Vitis vinifera]RVW80774.1 hypothetical protein CK203_050722 [Vitis vinifera]
MDRYQRVEKPRPESTINENEIRITAQGVIRNYISYASTLLQLMVSAASKSQFSPFCSCIARHKGHEDLASFSPSYHQQSAYGSHLNGRKYEGGLQPPQLS